MTRHLISLQSFLFATLVLITAAVALHRATPYKSVDEDVVRGKAAHAFESHYDERFPVKTLGINVWAAIDYTLFHEGRPGVVLGKDGWLYTDEEFNVAEDTEATLQDNLALIDHVRTQLAQNNVGLIIAVVPAKARVYPEHLGKRQPPALQRELYARLMAHIRQAQISAPELLPLLNEGKRRQPTFLRTDTHWTPFGAQLTAEAIAVQAHGLGLTALAPAKFQTQAQGTQSHSGDLFNFLPLDPYFAWLLPQPDTIELFTTQAQAENDAAADLLGDVPAPQVALVGSSYSYNPLWNFAGFLKQALATDVANYSREGVGPFIPMLDYLKGEDFRNHPPKLVVWEIPERYVIQQADLKSGKAKQ